ncbi:MAG TPA: YtxH domain-containing protein [Chloroflexia bacterium]|jgi:gas vesicle protein|nr:YtxH domain-containing protein [Chloroflexia bacterium]
MGVIGKTFRFVLGLGVGAAVGAAAALVVAPQSGRVSREEIQGRLNEAMSAAKKAQRDREKELQDYWEQEVNVKYTDDEEKDDKKDDKKDK